MKRRFERTRRPWLWVGAALLVAVGAGAGIRNQSESAAALDGDTAAAATASTLTPVAAETTVVEPTEVRETLPSSSVDSSPAPVTAAGVRAFIDPATGELTANPTRAQLERLALQARSSSSSRSVVGLRPFELSRGGRGLNLQGRFQTALRVERGEDGNFYQTCGDPAHDGATLALHTLDDVDSDRANRRRCSDESASRRSCHVVRGRAGRGSGVERRRPRHAAARSGRAPGRRPGGSSAPLRSRSGRSGIVDLALGPARHTRPLDGALHRARRSDRRDGSLDRAAPRHRLDERHLQPGGAHRRHSRRGFPGAGKSGRSAPRRDRARRRDLGRPAPELGADPPRRSRSTTCPARTAAPRWPRPGPPSSSRASRARTSCTPGIRARSPRRSSGQNLSLEDDVDPDAGDIHAMFNTAHRQRVPRRRRHLRLLAERHRAARPAELRQRRAARDRPRPRLRQSGQREHRRQSARGAGHLQLLHARHLERPALAPDERRGARRLGDQHRPPGVGRAERERHRARPCCHPARCSRSTRLPASTAATRWRPPSSGRRFRRPASAGCWSRSTTAARRRARAARRCVNAAALQGRIAMMVRGNCNYAVKVKNAQNAGAVGAVVVNNIAGPPMALGRQRCVDHDPGGDDPQGRRGSAVRGDRRRPAGADSGRTPPRRRRTTIRRRRPRPPAPPNAPFTLRPAVTFEAPSTCVENGTTLCLEHDRFRVRARWTKRDGTTGSRPRRQSDRRLRPLLVLRFEQRRDRAQGEERLRRAVQPLLVLRRRPHRRRHRRSRSPIPRPDGS